MELRFAHDFSQVRVHTDSNAALSARSVRALAYTSGRHVVFDHDQYTPGSGHGQRLLAHELAHIVQAGASGDIAPNRVGDSNDSAEYEAEHMAEVVIAGRPSQPLSASTHVARTLRRYISPLDILDYIGIGLDVAERIYLVHFYEGSDRERQLFLNTLFLAMDLVLAALPGAGGGGLAMRASRGAMAIVWRATPMAAKRVIAERVAVAMGWTAIRAMQMINVMMREGGEGGGSGTSEGRGSSSESGGGSRETKSTGSSRSGASHLEQRAGWREQARNWFREHNITSTGSRDQITGKLVFSNRAVGRDRRYYTIDELHGQIEIFNHRYQHIGAMDINRGISLPAVSNRRIDI
jgi:hypothetical protein